MIGLAGHRAALQVLRQQPVGAADGGVGVIVRAHARRCRIHADLVADRTVDHHHRADRARVLAARRELRRPRARESPENIPAARPPSPRSPRPSRPCIPTGRGIAVGCMWPTISSGAWLVCASIAATRSSVGSTIGSLSVQLFSRNSCCRLSSVSGSSRRGVDSPDLDGRHARRPAPLVSASTTSCMTGRPVIGSLPLT